MAAPRAEADGRPAEAIERGRSAHAVPAVPAGAAREIEFLRRAGRRPGRMRGRREDEHLAHAERAGIAGFNPRPLRHRVEIRTVVDADALRAANLDARRREPPDAVAGELDRPFT